MKIIPVKRYKDIKEELGGHPNSDNCRYYYRGIRYDYKILPSIYYDDVSKMMYSTDKIREYETNLINGFYDCLRNYYHITPFRENDWNLWFMSRHFGLKSRLIDFTKDITVALQFAFEMSGNCPAHLHCLNIDCVPGNVQSDIHKDPFNFNTSCLIQPSLQYRGIMNNLGTSRPFIQSSKFFYQSIETIQKPLAEQYSDNCWKIFEIQPDSFETIKKEITADTGYLMDKPLLIKNHTLDKQCENLNKDCLKN